MTRRGQSRWAPASPDGGPGSAGQDRPSPDRRNPDPDQRNPERPDRRRRGRLARWVVVVALVLGVVYAAAWVATPYSGMARAVAWLEADTGDIDRFPARTAHAGDDPWELTVADQPIADLTVTVDGRDEPLSALLDRTGTEAFLVVRGDELLVERYAPGRDRDDLHTSFSVAKSILSAVVGGAVAEGHLDVDDPVTEHVPELAARDPRFADVTIESLLTMSSGLRYEERSLPWSDDALTYYAADLRRLALRRTEVVELPGRWHYNNYNPLLVGLVLERATGEPVTALLERYVWRPAGMEGDASWSLDSERSGFEKLESGVNARPIDLARFGMLHRDDGVREGRQVLPAGWVQDATSTLVETPHGYGYGRWWWVVGDGPRPAFLAAGNHGQFVHVSPEDDTVIVRVGGDQGVPTPTWVEVFAEVAATYGG